MKKIMMMLMLSFLFVANVKADLKSAVDMAYNADFDAALRIMDSHIASHPNDPLGYIVRGTAKNWKQTVYDYQGKYDNEILEDYKYANKIAFTQWDADQNNVDKMVNLGNSNMYLAKKWLDLKKKMRSGLILKKARNYLEMAVAKDPSRYDAYLGTGIFNFYAANIPSSLKFLASIIGIRGDEQKGLQYLNQAANNPNIFQADALFILTHALGKTKKSYGQSILYIDKLISKYPNNPVFRHVKGEYLALGEKYADSRNAFNDYFSFCSSKPKDFCAEKDMFLANYFYAFGLVEAKQWTEAEGYIVKADQLNKNRYMDRSVRLDYMRGLTYKNLGNKTKAKESFEKAVLKAEFEKSVADLAQKELKSL